MRHPTILWIILWAGVLLEIATAPVAQSRLIRPAQAQAVVAPAQPTNLAAVHRSGQTFITWTERAELSGERYRVYRHTQPITGANLAQATMLYEVAEGSSRFFANRYNVDSSGVWQARYVDRFVITDGGGQLPAGTGLLVWTLSRQDLGGSSGNGYYAVTTVNSAGTENRSDVSTVNARGPVSEQVGDPLPVEIPAGIGARGRVFIQYMDLLRWNPTFHAPHAANDYYGLNSADPAVANAIQYAYDYIVYEPDPTSCGGSVPTRVPVMLILHGWGGNSYGPATSDPDPWWCAYKIYPIDVDETWYFGFARSHDYRRSSTVGAGDVIVLQKPFYFPGLAKVLSINPHQHL